MKVRLRLALIIVLHFFFSIVIRAQEYSYAHYNVREGLAGATVYAMTEDQDGFLWIGTETGLSRFDGASFVNFTTADGLPDNEILRLFVDSKNRVWIMPFRYSLCYYRNGKIYSKADDPILKQIDISSEVLCVAEDKDGNIIILERTAIWIVSPVGTIRSIKRIEDEEFSSIRMGISASGYAHVFLTRKSGISLIEVSALGLRVAENLTGYVPASYNFSYISAGLEIYRSGDSIVCINRAQKKKVFFPIPTNFVGVSAIDSNTLSINTGVNAELFEISTRRSLGTFVPGNYVSSAYKDQEGSIWFTTLGKGIYRLSSLSFRNFTLPYNRNTSPAYCIADQDGTILMGSDNFLLYRFNPKGQVISYQKLDIKNSQSRITSMLNTTEHGLFLGTDAGLAQLIGASLNEWEPSVSIKALSRNQDTLYVATSFNVVAIDMNSRTIIDTIWDSRSTAVHTVGPKLYIGTLNGLYQVSLQSPAVFLGEKIPALAERISAITTSNDGTVWIGTFGKGIVGLSGNEMKVNLTIANGLTSDICRSLFFDGHYLWAGTDKGMNKIDISDTSYNVTTYTNSSGMSSDMINAVFVKDSNVFVATPSGLSYFNEASLSSNSACRLVLTRIFADNDTLHTYPAKLVLPHDNANIRFEFSGISFKSAGDMAYYHKLTGIDGDWKMTNQPFLEYVALPSGNYTLEIYAVNKFGVKSNTIRQSFSVKATLIEKTWFRVLLIIAGFSLLWFTMQWRIRAIRVQDNLKQSSARKVAELEQMALKSQMNPHFIFNSLNSIQQYVIDKDILGANKFITEFARLIRMTLELSAKSQVSISEEKEFLSTYLNLEKTRFEDKFSCRIEISHSIDRDHTYIPPMLLQPFIENSIRHGVRHRTDKNGLILVEFEIRDEFLVCTIEDNGVGRQIAGKYKSLEPIEYQSKGLTLTAKRIEMLNKTQTHPIFMIIEDLINDDGRPLGTRVILKFPIQETFKLQEHA